MPKITVITGEQGSGKSTLARRLALGKKWIVKYNVNKNTLNRFFDNIDETTEVIIIDELICNTKKDNEDLIKFFASLSSIEIRKPYSIKRITIKVPEMIIICRNVNAKKFKDWDMIDFIECNL